MPRFIALIYLIILEMTYKDEFIENH